MLTHKTLGKASLVSGDAGNEFGKYLFLEFNEYYVFVGYFKDGKLDFNACPYMGAGRGWTQAQNILKLMNTI